MDFIHTLMEVNAIAPQVADATAQCRDHGAWSPGPAILCRWALRGREESQAGIPGSSAACAPGHTLASWFVPPWRATLGRGSLQTLSTLTALRGDVNLEDGWKGPGHPAADICRWMKSFHPLQGGRQQREIQVH